MFASESSPPSAIGVIDIDGGRAAVEANTNGECAYVLNVWGVGYRLVAAS